MNWDISGAPGLKFYAGPGCTSVFTTMIIITAIVGICGN
jgi:hypothetical protein